MSCILSCEILVGIVHTVCLNISLVNNVETESVAKGEESRIVGIVACSDHIYVVALENIEVLEHVIHRRNVAEKVVAIVAVYALRLNLFAVYVYFA